MYTMKKYNNNFKLIVTLDLTLNACKGHMTIFESLELQ